MTRADKLEVLKLLLDIWSETKWYAGEGDNPFVEFMNVIEESFTNSGGTDV